jgi:hypothetical protein
MGRLEGRDYGIYSYKAGTECQTCATLRSLSKPASKQVKNRSRIGVAMTAKRVVKSKVGMPDEIACLRALAHDLSNALEAILQATYLLDRGKLDGDSKRWVQLINSSSQEAARINRQIREHLRSLSEGKP